MTKPVYNDHLRGPKFVAVVDGCLLFRDLNWDSKIVVAVGRRLLTGLAVFTIFLCYEK